MFRLFQLFEICNEDVEKVLVRGGPRVDGVPGANRGPVNYGKKGHQCTVQWQTVDP